MTRIDDTFARLKAEGRKGFVAYISRHGFAPFAWYRIAAGLAAGAFLLLR